VHTTTVDPGLPWHASPIEVSTAGPIAVGPVSSIAMILSERTLAVSPILFYM